MEPFVRAMASDGLRIEKRERKDRGMKLGENRVDAAFLRYLWVLTRSTGGPFFPVK